jgi:PBP1b-binding outer membrane lipoprotein LpoB
MSKINGMVRNVAGVASALALALFLNGCAKQESVAPVNATADVQADSHAQMVAQADIPEVIVTASRDSAVAAHR